MIKKTHAKKSNFKRSSVYTAIMNSVIRENKFSIGFVDLATFIKIIKPSKNLTKFVNSFVIENMPGG